MRKESPLIIVWDGDRIDNMFIHAPTATCPQPNEEELELVRIFQELKRLKDDIKRRGYEDIWHRCNNKLRPYPNYFCSCCMGKSPNFNAYEKYKDVE